MMILMAYGIPFPITLRGNKNERSRYISSLKKANKAFIEPYAALIAMRVYETFKEIDSNIIGANLPSILTFKDASRGSQLIRPWQYARDGKYIVK